MARNGTIIQDVVSRLLGFLGNQLGMPTAGVGKSNRASARDVDRYKETAGTGQDWARSAYGEYYATSVPIYSAIKVRSDALARPQVLVLRDGEPVADEHPVQRLMDRVNRWYSRGDLWRATEIYLGLWGSALLGD